MSEMVILVTTRRCKSEGCRVQTPVPEKYFSMRKISALEQQYNLLAGNQYLIYAACLSWVDVLRIQIKSFENRPWSTRPIEVLLMFKSQVLLERGTNTSCQISPRSHIFRAHKKLRGCLCIQKYLPTVICEKDLCTTERSTHDLICFSDGKESWLLYRTTSFPEQTFLQYWLPTSQNQMGLKYIFKPLSTFL